VIKPYPKNKNRVMDEFKNYAESVKSGAVVGDSFMYLLATPLLYLYIQKNNITINTFISIVCFYLIGYLIYQKPKISMK
jgi:putative flippase GtrA